MTHECEQQPAITKGCKRSAVRLPIIMDAEEDGEHDHQEIQQLESAAPC